MRHVVGQALPLGLSVGGGIIIVLIMIGRGAVRPPRLWRGCLGMMLALHVKLMALHFFLILLFLLSGKHAAAREPHQGGRRVHLVDPFGGGEVGGQQRLEVLVQIVGSHCFGGVGGGYGRDAGQLREGPLDEGNGRGGEPVGRGGGGGGGGGCGRRFRVIVLWELAIGVAVVAVLGEFVANAGGERGVAVYDQLVGLDQARPRWHVLTVMDCVDRGKNREMTCALDGCVPEGIRRQVGHSIA
mmetsp:Transcript_32908/g.53406  ORF Transcript_32908/g.53406 Transcript_32908/m.53406 type:complete len:242 (-) Transcript_32908:679-1404(-)